jgi:glucuronate isomerase
MSLSHLDNRLLEGSEEFKAVASELYTLVKDLPIISPHGHVDPLLILENKPFDNPSDLFIYHDHYITRMLHAQGYSMEKLGKSVNPDHREAWRILCSNSHVFAGTASGYWLDYQLASLFNISEPLSAANADSTYDQILEKLVTKEFTPQELLKKFNLKFLATTDDPTDDLSAHKKLAELSNVSCKIVPTFRPDSYLDPRVENWSANVAKLLASAGKNEISYSQYISALEERRAYFIEHGATSADHGVFEPFTFDLSESEASSFFDRALSGTLSADEGRLFAGHMLSEMARMSTNDGLVMTVHAGVYRNHSSVTLEKFGRDTGHDIPVKVEFTQNLRPLLEKYGLNLRLNLILFCLDESTVTREIAPLASFYPSVYVGAPWWFFDSPSGLRRHRETVTDIAGFYRGSGFIDDTRAFLSIQARHDLARRVDSGYLAELVVSGRIKIEVAKKIAVDLVTAVPMNAFKL